MSNLRAKAKQEITNKKTARTYEMKALLKANNLTGTDWGRRLLDAQRCAKGFTSRDKEIAKLWKTPVPITVEKVTYSSDLKMLGVRFYDAVRNDNPLQAAEIWSEIKARSEVSGSQFAYQKEHVDALTAPPESRRIERISEETREVAWILSENTLLDTEWGIRILEAQRGAGFTTKAKAEAATWVLSSWQYEVPDKPIDPELGVLGARFYEEVRDEQPLKAAKTLVEIKARESVVVVQERMNANQQRGQDNGN